MKKIFYILPVILMWSCEKTIDFDIPFDSPKLTIDSKIHNGRTVSAIISNSVYVLDEDDNLDPGILGAYLYEDGIKVDSLSRNVTRRTPFNFIFRHQASIGHTYEIEAYRDGLETVRASDYLPDPVEMDWFSYDSDDRKIELNFQDPGDSKDYYLLRLIYEDDDEEFPIFYETFDPLIDFFYAFESDFLEPREGAKFGHLGFLTDDTFNGKSKTVTLFIDGIIDLPGQTVELSAQVIRISRDYYLHERSKASQENDGGVGFTEPAQIYGNVENGYGIVACGALVERKFNL